MSRFSKKLKREFNETMDNYFENNSIDLKDNLKNELNLNNDSINSKNKLKFKLIIASASIALLIIMCLFVPKIISYNKNIPVYQNMEVVENVTLQNTSVNVKAINRQISYYAQSNEKIIIKVNIRNPQSYEILSLRLNDTLFQSYQFLYGSNSEEIYVEFEVQNNPGIQSITIDQIKYVQGTTIKNAKYMGDRTINVAIEYQEIPNVLDFNIQMNDNAVLFNINIVDIHNLSNNVILYLFDGKNLIKRDLFVGYNDFVIELEYQKNYQYQIVSMFDSLNGKGMTSYNILEGEFEIISPIKIEQIKISKESINFIINAPLAVTIGNIKIYQGNEQIFTDVTQNEGVYSFNNLKSDTEYNIIIDYSYQLNNITYENKHTFEVNTTNKELPTVLFTSLVCFNNTVYLFYELEDKDSVGKLLQINVYKEDILVKEYKDIEYSMDIENKFEIDIDSDGNYKIGIVYEYDMNDGKGKQYLEEKIIVDR